MQVLALGVQRRLRLESLVQLGAHLSIWGLLCLRNLTSQLHLLVFNAAIPGPSRRLLHVDFDIELGVSWQLFLLLMLSSGADESGSDSVARVQSLDSFLHLD